MADSGKIMLNNVPVRTKHTEFGEYLCLTDLAKVTGDRSGEIFSNWMRLVGTIEFLKEFELKYNPAFNHTGYDKIRREAGTVRFRLSAKQWITDTAAVGIISDAGRYGGTYAHNAIALEFCAVVSPAFKLGVYVDYLELKAQAAQNLLAQYEFFLKKIEDDTLEANRLATDLLREMGKAKRLKD